MFLTKKDIKQLFRISAKQTLPDADHAAMAGFVRNTIIGCGSECKWIGDVREFDATPPGLEQALGAPPWQAAGRERVGRGWRGAGHRVVRCARQERARLDHRGVMREVAIAGLAALTAIAGAAVLNAYFPV